MGPFEPAQFHDLDNPYAPPQSAATLGAGAPLGINDVVHWSWSIFRARMRSCMLIYWFMYSLNLLLIILLIEVQKSLEVEIRDEILYKLLYILSMFVAYVIQFWLTIGMTIGMLKIARGQPARIDEIFRGGPFVLTVIIAWIIHKIVIALPIAVAVGVIVGGVLLMENQSGLGALLLFMVVSSLAGLVFIYLSARLSMYFYTIVDLGSGVIDSFQESWRLTRNQVGTITLMYCVQFVLLLAGFLALCVGLFFAIPLLILVETVTYLALVNGATSSPTTPNFSRAEET